MSPRVYERKFDWNEARRLRETGLSCQKIADRLGVSQMAVWRVVTPGAIEKMAEDCKRWSKTGICDDCGGPMNRVSRSHGSTRCVPCANKVMATTVREATLQCFRCREWKTDDGFPFNRAARKARRGRHTSCRPCQTIARREYRERNREADNAYQREYRRNRRAKGLS